MNVEKVSFSNLISCDRQFHIRGPLWRRDLDLLTVLNMQITALTSVTQMNVKNKFKVIWKICRPDLFQSVSVFSSIVNTDHQAVLVKPTASRSSDLPRRNTQAHVKLIINHVNHSPVHIGNLCKALENFSWTGLLVWNRNYSVSCYKNSHWIWRYSILGI